MKKLLLIVATTLTIGVSHAQHVDVKVNVASAAIAIFNPSLEASFAKKSALTIDYIGAYATENYMGTGEPFLLTMVTFGYRHYLLNTEHKGLFVGGDIGFNTFRMNKGFALFSNTGSDFRNQYDVGSAYLIGATLGYKYQFHPRWSAEISLSYGWQHTQHEGYGILTGEKVFDLNASAEWTAYKAGIYISYRIF